MRHDDCSEARLLLYLDGEATGEERAATKAHLDACWLCRGRLAELERDLHRIADAIAVESEQGYPEQRIDAARQRLQSAMAMERRSGTRHATPLSRLWRLAWIPAAAAAFSGGVVWVASIPNQAPPPAASAPVRQVIAKLELPPAPALAPPPSPAPPAPAPAPAPASGPARAELARFALQVYETAHTLGLTVEKPLQIRIDENCVRVAGLSMEEQGNLRQALELDDRQAGWFSGAPPAETPGETIVAPLVEGPAVSLDHKIPLHSQIAAITGDDGVKSFADRAVRLSEQINRRAHALDELAQALPEADEALLDEEGKMRLSLLVVEHLRTMERLAGELRVHLALFAASQTGSEYPDPKAWQEIAAQYRASYAPVHQAILELLTLQPGREIDRAASFSALADLWRLDVGRSWHPRLTSQN